MRFNIDQKPVIAFSTRALFDFSAEDRVFREQGSEAYAKLQRQLRNRPAKPGVAFAFLQKLMRLNGPAYEQRVVEAVIVSKNDPASGARAFSSLAHYGMPDVCAGAFTNGRDVLPDIKAFNCVLFITTDKSDAQRAVAMGHAAALMYPRRGPLAKEGDNELRLAFDYDGVLADDSSERVTHHEGLEAFTAHEKANARRAMGPGPFRNVMVAFNTLKKAGAPIRDSLITARVWPENSRALSTLRRWGLDPDEARFVGGDDKTPAARSFDCDILFEDSPNRVVQLAPHVAVGHVIYGVKNGL